MKYFIGILLLSIITSFGLCIALVKASQKDIKTAIIIYLDEISLENLARHVLYGQDTWMPTLSIDEFMYLCMDKLCLIIESALNENGHGIYYKEIKQYLPDILESDRYKVLINEFKNFYEIHYNTESCDDILEEDYATSDEDLVDMTDYINNILK